MATLELSRSKPQGFNNCLICMQPRARNGTYAVASCSTAETAHAYCLGCIKEWIAQRPLCPMCVQNFDPASVNLIREHQLGLAESVEDTLNDLFLDPKYQGMKDALQQIVDIDEKFMESGIVKKALLALIPRSLQEVLNWSRTDPLLQVKTGAAIISGATIGLMLLTHMISLTVTNNYHDAYEYLVIERFLFAAGALLALVINPAMSALNLGIRRTVHLLQNFRGTSNEDKLQLSVLLSCPKFIRALYFLVEALRNRNSYGHHMEYYNNLDQGFEDLKGFFYLTLALSVLFIGGNFLHQNRQAIKDRISATKTDFDNATPMGRGLPIANIAAYTCIISLIIPAFYQAITANTWNEQEEAKEALLYAAKLTIAITGTAGAIAASKTVQSQIGRVGRVVGNALVLAGRETVNGGVGLLQQVGRFAWARIRAHIPRYEAQA